MNKIVINLPEKYIYSKILSVRIYDINYGNHVGHDSIISLLHEARVAFLRENNLSEMDIYGSGWIMSSISALYKSQAKYGDDLEISIGIGEISQTSIDFIYQAINVISKNEIARAITKMVFFDYKKNKIMPVPKEFVNLIRR
ncbi:MAG: acyl-CoA thioesterase [Gammaproteobacteria bacterium]|nr:MAG: acyl-CoA thioesterase [Gammaproteobacteria bacterium]